MVFSTFHQVKGLERKVVIVMNFDDFMPTMRNLQECSNELYVALTRAKERMSIFHHYQNNYLGFLNPDELKKTCYVEMHKRIDVESDGPRGGNAFTYKATDLTRHMSLHTLQKAMEFIRIKEVIPGPGTLNKIHLPTKCEQGGLFESIAEINGVAIPSYFAYSHTGLLPIVPKTKQGMIKREMLTPSYLLQLSNEYCSFLSQYDFKLNQIKTYDWLNEDLLRQTNQRMIELIPVPNKAEFEVHVVTKVGKTTINGVIDCVDADGTVWEFKCTQELCLEDYLQLAIYAFMHKSPCKPSYKIANILTGKVFQIEADYKQLNDLVLFMIYQKKNANACMEDQEFIDMNERAKTYVFNRESCANHQAEPVSTTKYDKGDSDISDMVAVFGRCLL
jgi:hypothetical protein